MSTSQQFTYTFPVVVTQDEVGMYLGVVPALKGCHTQAKSLPELYERLEEVMGLCLEVRGEKEQAIPQEKFIGVQQIEVTL